MKLSVAIAGACVAGAAANAIPAAEAEKRDDIQFDLSHIKVNPLGPGGFLHPRDAEAEAEPELSKRMMMGGRMPGMGGRGMPCPNHPGAAAAKRVPEHEGRRNVEAWVPGPISVLLSRLGLDIGAPSRNFDLPQHSYPAAAAAAAAAAAHHHEDHHYQHRPEHGDGHHKEHPGHGGHRSDEDNVDISIFIPIREPIMKEEEMIRIMPIFGGEDVVRMQAEHEQRLKQLKHKEEQLKQQEDSDDEDDSDSDDEDDHHPHKHHKDHKHKHHHKHKEHKNKNHKHKGMMKTFNKACHGFAALSPQARAVVSAMMTGTVFLAVFGLAFLIARRRNMSREERKARRRQRKEARRAAKHAYKAAKAAARNSKEAEAGFAIEEEALPSYKDDETDALVVRN